MSAQLDQLIVPARDRMASARLLAQLLGVPWAEPVPQLHFCFRVSEAEFGAILGRIQAAGAWGDTHGQ